ncbi:hypothetical protein [Methylorubrum extorquens]|nr:hypothetical protein [Methylorubrum extorquens]UYW30160.1 hypothetical protein OKB92_14090 [Methylorubrum extorquens]
MSARISTRQSRSSTYIARNASTASSFVGKKPLSVLLGFVMPTN